MNATRAATIRLRSSFDGAVSLGRVQTPTLAIVAQREEEIRAFKPEPYWLVDATFAADGERVYEGRYHAGAKPRLATAAEAAGDRRGVRAGARARSPSSTRPTRKERAPLLYDLTSLQREANTRFGFSARRTLAAAQRLYEEHTAITYPRTNSRFITRDLIGEIKPTARHLGHHGAYAKASEYVLGLDVLPLARVVNDAKVTDHHAILPTPSTQHPERWRNQDDRRVFDLVARRFLAVFHPDAVFENTRVETTVSEHVFRTRGKVLLVPGLARRVRRGGGGRRARRRRRGPRAAAPAPGARRGRRGPRDRGAREGDQASAALHRRIAAGGDGDRGQARRRRGAARGDEGVGHRHARDARGDHRAPDRRGLPRARGRALIATEKGRNVVRLLGEHPLTSPGLTGEWEHRLAKIEQGGDSREAFMGDIVKFTDETVHDFDERLKDVRIPRANLGPCPVCGRDVVENRKGFSCWSREDPGCGFVIWKGKAGKQLNAAVAAELIKHGRTEKPVAGFKGRSGRTFRARLAHPAGRGRQVARRVRRAVGARGHQAPRVRDRGAAPGNARTDRGRSGVGALRVRQTVGSGRDHGGVGLTLVTGPANSAKAGYVLDAYRAALAARAAARRADLAGRRALHARAGGGGRGRRRRASFASSGSRAEIAARAGVPRAR